MPPEQAGERPETAAGHISSSHGQAGRTRTMPAEQRKQTEVRSSHIPSHAWPVSLLGCLDGTPSSSQFPWPWLLFKGFVCPAALLGANETLFQGEELADICCLQPHSWCGPTCRSLNAELCGLGNDGLKLCAHTCLMQGLCSWLCLGLPYVAWLAALQRQRVMHKHGVAVSEEEAWAAACFPCSLIQMHALLQQQQQARQQPVPAPLRAPKVQQMTGAACEQPTSSARSQAGPLTSAMTSSKTLRTLQSTHSDGTCGTGAAGRAAAAAAAAAGGGALQQQQQPGTGSADGSSSDGASETGVVNSPLPDRHLQPPGVQEMPRLGSSSGNGGSKLPGSRAASSGNGATAAGGIGSSRCAQAGTPAQQQQQQQQVQVQVQQLGPLSSARSHSSTGGGQQQQQPGLPPRPGGARHVRTTSLGSTAAGVGVAAAAVAGSAAACANDNTEARLGAAAAGCSPDPGCIAAAKPSSSTSRVLANGSAVLASQSCQLPRGFYSNSSSGALNAQPDTAAGGMTSRSILDPHHHQQQQCGGGGNVSSSAQDAGRVRLRTHAYSSPGLSCSKVSVGGSCSRLLELSHEDVPLCALKPTPGRMPRPNSSSAAGGLAACGVLPGITPGSLASSMQQQQPAGGAGGLRTEPDAAAAPHPQQQQGDGSCARDAALQQQPQQYATVQSDICNFASWLGTAASPSMSTTQHLEQEPQAIESTEREQQAPQPGLQQQEQEHDGEQQQHHHHHHHLPSVQRSDDDLCNMSPSAGDVGSPAAYPSLEASAACPPPPSPPVHKADAGACSQLPPSAEAAAAGGGDGDDDESGSAAASQTAAAASYGYGARPTVLSAAWAYMSDMCNLGGSFDAGGGSSRTALAAALGRLAEKECGGPAEEGPPRLQGAEGMPEQHHHQQQQAGHTEGSLDSSAAAGTDSAASTPGVGQQQQQRRPSNGRKLPLGSAAAAAAAALAAGSWPDTAPSPAQATLQGGSGANSMSGGGAAGSPAAPGCAAAAGSSLTSSSTCTNSTSSGAVGAHSAAASPHTLPHSGGGSRQGAAPGAAASSTGRGDGGGGRDASNQARSAAADADAPSPAGSSRQHRAAASAAGPASSHRRPCAVDPQMLAAVTGTADRAQLTASQEELATKLARLAFANPGAAKPRPRPTGEQQQQHAGSAGVGPGECPGTAAAAAGAAAAGPGTAAWGKHTAAAVRPQQQQQQHQRLECVEPFFPTMMSDVCNLGDMELEDDDHAPALGSSVSAAAAGGEAAAAAGPKHNQQPGRSLSSGGASLEPQQWAAGGGRGGGRGVGGSNAPLTAPGLGSLPGRAMRQQQQQTGTAGAAPAAPGISRLGRATSNGGGGAAAAAAAPMPAAPAAAAATAGAAGGPPSAGPLRAAMLLRGLRPAPGAAAHQPGAAPVGALTAAARRLTGHGDAGASAGGAAAATTAAAAAVCAPLGLEAAGEDSVLSLDSCAVLGHYRYPDSEPRSQHAGGQAADNPLYTNTLGVSEGVFGGAAAGSPRPASPTIMTLPQQQHFQQQLRAPAPAAVSGPDGGSAVLALTHRQQQAWQQAGRLGVGDAGAAAAAVPPAKAAAAAAVGTRAPHQQQRQAGLIGGHRGSADDRDDDGGQTQDNSRSGSPAVVL